MDQDSLVIDVLGFWLMFVLVLYTYVMCKLWSLRYNCKRGLISFRRYTAYRRTLGWTCFKVTGVSILTAVLLYGIIAAFNPPVLNHTVVQGDG